MVLEDVAHRAGLLVERAAVLDADRLGDRDLHVVDIPAVPERLEDAVPEPEDHQVPDGLLPEVVVDAVDLRLAEDPEHLAVELLRRVEVPPERLLDDDPPPPAVVLLVVQPAAPELLDDLGKGRGLRRQVEQDVVPGRHLLVHRLEALGHRVEEIVVREVALDVGDPRQEVPLHVGLELDPAVDVERAGDVLPERLVVERPPPDGEEGPVGRQEVGPPELGQRREDLAVREVAGRPEQDHDVRVRHALQAEALPQRVDVAVRRRPAALAVAGEAFLADRQGARRRGRDRRRGPWDLGGAWVRRPSCRHQSSLALLRLDRMAAELVSERREDLRRRTSRPGVNGSASAVTA